MPSLRFQKLKNQLSGPIGHCLIYQRPDDVYISAYPRSGSTWLRTMLVNIMLPDSMSNPDVFNAMIPAVSIRNAKEINRLESPRHIMTHSTWRPSIKKSVYVVRDGRDSLISSYHYHVTRNGLNIGMDQFYQRYRNNVYGQTWEAHTLSWLGKGAATMGDRLHCARFEELKQDTPRALSHVCDFIGIDVDMPSINIAVEHASLESAKKIERERQGNLASNNASFYREGKTQQWKSPEYSELIRLFENDSRRALDLAGYE